MEFLREALRVLMDAIMDAEVSARIGDDPASQTREAEAIASAMKRLIAAVNTVMSGIEPYQDS